MTDGNDDTVRALKPGGSIPAALDGYYRAVSRVPVRKIDVKEAFDYLQEQCVLEVPVCAQLVRVNTEVLEVFASKLDGEPKAIRLLAETLRNKLDTACPRVELRLTVDGYYGELFARSS